MYEYLIGSLIFGVVWFVLFLYRKDLRKPMIWTAFIYTFFSFVIVAIWYLIRSFVYLGETIVPSYWYPHTVFNLGSLTGFAGIEDLLFLIFIGGIATCIYEIIFSKEIKIKKSYHPHIKAFILAFIAFFIFAYFVPVNLIYAFIFSNIVGAFALIIERKDLIIHSIFGALSFLIVYFIIFIVFIIIFPDFITQFYNITNLSGINIIGIPLEEYLYAISFGLMWAPMYEYEHGEKNKNK